MKKGILELIDVLVLIDTAEAALVRMICGVKLEGDGVIDSGLVVALGPREFEVEGASRVLGRSGAGDGEAVAFVHLWDLERLGYSYGSREGDCGLRQEPCKQA